MIHTEIEINASPVTTRQTFLDFAALPKYHSSFFQSIAPVKAEKKSPEPGDKLLVNVNGMALTPVVEVNSPTEFTWRGTFGSTWLFTGAHSFNFLPVGEKTRLVHSEEISGLFAPVFMIFGKAKAEEGFRRFNEDLKNYVEVGKGK
ncbi:uncharacterized protein N7477_009910 [Penicillium maclennaniae]|uniref:uncharacterized protein n=1 Tax=Penicillium maclennaniae TaxID=1343394 RepID=UPI0025403BE1|nr:uncharacterized protein N7477_009910 [Penicillium maclennaniae]KAJ5662294.1 hypothetical protein N7477_009910 [Penicillium maclennaniae]